LAGFAQIIGDFINAIGPFETLTDVRFSAAFRDTPDIHDSEQFSPAQGRVGQFAVS
jgi:hypothetical protein